MGQLDDRVLAPETRTVGARGLTSTDIARQAGVSQATVSRVLRGYSNVTPETRERVLEVLERTGYVPNALARAMVTRRTDTIGVVIDDLRNPFYPELFAGVASALHARGQRVIVWSAREAGETAAIESIRERRVDGVIFTTAVKASGVLAEALKRGSAIVLINRHAGLAGCDQVTTDNSGGGRLVAEYFLRHEHTRIGLIAGPTAASTALEREAGFRAALERQGIRPIVDPDGRREFTHDAGFASMRALMAMERPPSAVFCANDLVAMGALDAVRVGGRPSAPARWIVGFDDVEMASWPAFDLTTVRQPVEEMAGLATDLLMRRILDPDRPYEHRRTAAALVVRGSTGHAQPR